MGKGGEGREREGREGRKGQERGGFASRLKLPLATPLVPTVFYCTKMCEQKTSRPYQFIILTYSTCCEVYSAHGLLWPAVNDELSLNDMLEPKIVTCSMFYVFSYLGLCADSACCLIGVINQ